MSRAWLLVLVGALAACKKPAHQAPAPTPVPPLPATLPSALPVADLVGAAACAECHRAIYDAWKKSPHGRSMALPSAETVLGNFDAATIQLADGSVTPSHGPDGWFMDMRTAQGQERRKVDLVLASGRQHQLYVARSPDGVYSLLPLIWSTWTHEWLPTSLYQAGALDPASKSYWGRFDMTSGCFSCHLSQAYRRTGPAGGETAWVDLSVNCESCHGAGREHIARRRAGRKDDVYRSLHALGSAEDARLCGQCHGFASRPYVLPRAADGLPETFVTSLVNRGLRPDGTQGSTSYQYAGHVLSECYRKGEGSLTCKGCHQPHALTAQDFTGAPATGADSAKQCTICHRERSAPEAAAAHSHHSAKVRCVDCHMSYSWIGDSQARKQRTSDHSISIPRPAETAALGTPNACTGTCHQDRPPEWALGALRGWGYAKATVVRDWVQAIAAGRKQAPDAAGRLVPLLGDSSRYLQASALDLLAALPPDPALAPALAPLAGDRSPQLRALAIRALDTHDPARRQHWRELGLADPDPFVRMETFALYQDPQSLTPAAFDRELMDTLAFKALPVPSLVHLITLRHRRGELAEALALVELLGHIMIPREREALGLDRVRERIETQLRRSGGAGPVAR